MKHFLFFVAACLCSLLSLAQTQTITVGTLDARKGIYVPRLTTLPTAKPGFLVYKTSGADSGLYIGSITGNTWNKIFPGTGGSSTFSYPVGRGLKNDGTMLRLADSLYQDVGINTNGYNYILSGNGSKNFFAGVAGVSSFYSNFFTSPNTVSLNTYNSTSSNHFKVATTVAYVELSARVGGNPYPNKALYFYLYSDSIRVQSEISPGNLVGYQMRRNSNAGKYLLWGYDSTSGAFVGFRNLDTVNLYASKPYVANQIAAATLSSIPGVIDVQDVQDGGLRATNWRNQNYHDSSYLTVDKGNELYGGISSESRNKVVGEHWEFISAPASTTGGGNDLAIVGVGSGAVAGMASTPSPNRPGILVLQTGSTATGRCTIYNHSTMSMLMLGGGEFVTEFEVRHPTLYAAGEQYLTQFGLLSSISIDQNNAVYVVYDEGGQTSPGPGSANYKFITAAGNVRTVTTTTVPVVAGTTSEFQRLRIEVTAAADTARLYINGTLAATHTTNIPTNVAMTLMGNIMKYGTGTTSRTVQFDYINWRYKFTTTR